MKFTKEGPYSCNGGMSFTKIGYARCSTDRQDLSARKQALEKLRVSPDRIYTDHGLTGTNLARPGLDQDLAAVHEENILVVHKLDLLARSVPDARELERQLGCKTMEVEILEESLDKSRSKEPTLLAHSLQRDGCHEDGC
ncbi:Resolvase, N terminal domain [Aliiroseovarius crassostreae]|nr:Resolvase, N terminal domain [Aliiroseovarius crassostreae]